MLELKLVFDVVHTFFHKITFGLELLQNILYMMYFMVIRYYEIALTYLIEPNFTQLKFIYVYMFIITYVSFVLFRLKNHNLLFNYYVYNQLVRLEKETKNNRKNILVNHRFTIKGNRHTITMKTQMTKQFKILKAKIEVLNKHINYLDNNNLNNYRKYNLRSSKIIKK